MGKHVDTTREVDAVVSNEVLANNANNTVTSAVRAVFAYWDEDHNGEWGTPQVSVWDMWDSLCLMSSDNWLGDADTPRAMLRARERIAPLLAFS